VKAHFHKYHALENDFLVIESNQTRIDKIKIGGIARLLCDRHKGVGADGVVYLSPSKTADIKADIFNADGTWAEKSGNGLRIAGCFLALKYSRTKKFTIQTATTTDSVVVGKNIGRSQIVEAGIGEPSFETKSLPMRIKERYFINKTLAIGRTRVPVTCLSVGNPHCIVHCDAIPSGWKELGSDIESSSYFPHGTNVEFVRKINRKKIEVKEWERGVGETESSGTGAAASVCALVMLGLIERKCEVQFQTGTLMVEWSADDNIVRIKGPVSFIAQGTAEI